MKAWQVKRFLKSTTDVRPYGHLLRMVHFYNYTHVAQLRLMDIGPGLFADPTAIFRNGERIRLGSNVHVGPHAIVYAGEIASRVTVGDCTLIGPAVMITSANYDGSAGSPIYLQPKIEQDVVIGSDVWLGANAVVLPGVTIADHAIVGAGSVVIRDVPRGAIAMGNPARVIGYREGFKPVSPAASA